MKTSGRLAVVAMMALGWFTSFGQAIEPEVPGDQFSLEGALELFKQSESPEEFEKMLNSPDTKVNNLDLNGDGYIDYVRVVDRSEGSVHVFILQAIISESENQDIAVIELEKLANGKAVLQIVGDEAIYGVTTIIEPTREVRTYAGTRSTRTVVNVWAWPSVQFVYGPYYSGWISPWGWRHHPHWYHRWRPIAYVHYYPIWRPYYDYYVPCGTRRIVYAHHIYRPHRRTSIVVHNRYETKLTHYRQERRNDDRYGRTRADDRRAYVNNSRSADRDASQRRRDDVNLDRRSSSQREAVSAPNRRTIRERNAPAVRERSARPEVNRTAPQLRRSETPVRRTAPETNRRTVRRQPAPNPPAVERSRSTPAPAVKQRPATRERSAPPAIQRRPPTLNRGAAPSRNSGRVNSTPRIRQQRSAPPRASTPSINRGRQSTPSVRQRSAP